MPSGPLVRRETGRWAGFGRTVAVSGHQVHADHSRDLSGHIVLDSILSENFCLVRRYRRAHFYDNDVFIAGINFGAPVPARMPSRGYADITPAVIGGKYR